MDNLVDGVENFAAAHSWATLLWWLLVIVMFGLLLARWTLRCVVFLLDHAPEAASAHERFVLLLVRTFTRPMLVGDAVMFVVLLWIWQYGAIVEDRSRLQDLQNDVRDLTHDLDRITWKLDESACKEAL